MKNISACCCPLIEEKNWFADYEVLTDGLSSMIGKARSLVKDEKVREDLKTLVECAFELNPLARNTIPEIVKNWKEKLITMADHYDQPFNDFFLPLGEIDATSISSLRMYSKMIIRLLSKNNIKSELSECFHIMTNIFHLMWLKLSNEKVAYKSKSY